MVELWERREPIDIVTVSESLERSGDLEPVGGRALDFRPVPDMFTDGEV